MENVIYNTLTFLIVGGALIAVVIRLYKSFGSTQKNSCEDGCGGCTTKCDLKETFQKQA